MVSKKCGLTRSQDDPLCSSDPGAGMALHKNPFAPVVTLERTVESDADALNSRESREFLLQALIEGTNGFDVVSRAHGIDVDDVAVRGDDSKILLFEIAKSLRHQAGANKEYERNGGLHDDERFLRKMTAVAGGTIQATKGFGGIGVRRNPCGYDAENYPSEE